jgi:hypothetical protein
MTARDALRLILKAHGLTLEESGFIRDLDNGDLVGELLTVKYDEKGGLRYSIKMNTAIDYIDLDLDIGNIRES